MDTHISQWPDRYTFTLVFKDEYDFEFFKDDYNNYLALQIQFASSNMLEKDF